MTKRMKELGLAIGVALAVSAPAGAVTINGGLQSGFINQLEDQSREAFIDVGAGNVGTVGVGDVLISFYRIDNIGALSANNQIYGIGSAQIASINAAGFATFTTTTAAGLRLQDITGNANTAGGIVAVYDKAAPFSQNLITTSPGNLVGGAAVTMQDYLALITAEGTLRLTLGTGVVPPDFLDADGGTNLNSTTPVAAIPLLATSLPAGEFNAGLSILFNNTVFSYLPFVPAQSSAGGAITNHQVGVSNGALRGTAFLPPSDNVALWSVMEGFAQCGPLPGPPGNGGCGLINDADFFVIPLSVPEPGSLALLGVALLGLAATRRRKA